MSEQQPPVPPTSHDFPDHWGFYLLQAINRLDDKIESVRRDVHQRIDGLDARMNHLDAKIEALQRDVHQRIDTLDGKFDQKLTSLQYWYWATLVVIIMGFVTLFFTRP